MDSPPDSEPDSPAPFWEQPRPDGKSLSTPEPGAGETQKTDQAPKPEVIPAWMAFVGVLGFVMLLGLVASTFSGGDAGDAALTPATDSAGEPDTSVTSEAVEPAPTTTTSERPTTTSTSTSTTLPASAEGVGPTVDAFTPLALTAPLPEGVTGPITDVEPTDDVAQIVASGDEGDVFRFAPGIYQDLEFFPKDGQSFLGLNQAVLDGSGTPELSAAFTGASDDVTIIGFEIRNYKPCTQCGAVNAQNGASDNAPAEMLSSNWHLESLEVHNNSGVGINIGPKGTVRNVAIYENGRLGITSHVGDDITVENCEINNNNTEKYNPADEGGGSKFKYTTRLIVRDCHFHDNFGYGIWTDIDNVDAVIDHNLVQRETWSCIAHEVSFAVTISNNTVEDCGLDGDPWLFKAGIQIQNSPNVRVIDNIVTNSFNGISLIMQDRSGDSQYRRTWILQNALVRGNLVTRSGQSGAVDDRFGDDGLAPPIPESVIFEDNTWVAGLPEFEGDLILPPTVNDSRRLSDFRWGESQLDWTGWQAVDNDETGSFTERDE